ncbi:MAG: ATP12 family protein [Pseudomonadota bacterium]|nr:ATP12 family protein [Pseudomonadota bacterium]
MFTILKTNSYFLLLFNKKLFNTPMNNAVKIYDKKIAFSLKEYLNLNIKKKKKYKYFEKILYFYFDLSIKNRTILEKKIIDNLDSDLLCYRADKYTELEKIQSKMFDPLVLFVKEKFMLDFQVENSVIPFKQDNKNVIVLNKILKKLDNLKFTTYYFINNLTNSNIIALNFLVNNIKLQHIWNCLSLDETYSFRKWGKDKEAIEMLNNKKKELDEIINFHLLFNKKEI